VSEAVDRPHRHVPKVAVVHYWWLANRGGEHFAVALLRLFPDADLFVHVCDEALVRRTLGPGFRGRIFCSFIARLPGAKTHYQHYLPLMPLALEQLDLSEYDLVISCESGPAKGVLTRPDALHVCYCHSPMRYLWDQYHEYARHAGPLVRALWPLVAHWLRMWDRHSADRVDLFLANSAFVAARIRKCYRREARVVYSPVSVHVLRADQPRGSDYLVLGQLVRYKRADLAVRACTALNLPLAVIGEGEQYEELRALAGPTVRLLGHQPAEVVRERLQTCRALLFPGVEDFGLVPVEAMAAGAPVIAYARGGVLETVVDGVTGCFFHEQSAAALQTALQRIESGELRIDPQAARARALQFAPERFESEMRELLDEALANHARAGAAQACSALNRR
jgi:glycosyltransferase involved in cell wall biosynthesis